MGAGTVALLIMCSDTDNLGDLINGLSTMTLLITLPVTCISFAIAYSDQHPVGAILLVQSIMFLLFWLIAFLILNNTNKTNTQTWRKNEG